MAEEQRDASFAALVSASNDMNALRQEIFLLEESLQRDKHQLHTIQRALEVYENSDAMAQIAVVTHRMLNDAHKQVRALRIKFVQSILDEVSAEADRLYQIIHPNESAKSVRFALDEAKRASLNQYGEFAGHSDIEPQGYYSDSHLDTLGFCLWMALAQRLNSKEKIIVLDDVFTSVDVAHLGRIIDLIDSEADRFAQVFIFTHNRNWFDRYRFNQAVSGKADKLELRRWTPSVGVRADWTSEEIKEVAALAAEFKQDGGVTVRQELASRCGILLEALLGLLSKQYRTSVPNTPDGLYTLGDLLGSCTKVFNVMNVRRHADPIEVSNEASCSSSSLLSGLNSLKALAIPIRNGVGCHFNHVAAQLSDTEVDDFATATVEFAEALVCSHHDCGQIPQRDEGGYHRCSCKRTRLLLTKKP